MCRIWVRPLPVLHQRNAQYQKSYSEQAVDSISKNGYLLLFNIFVHYEMYFGAWYLCTALRRSPERSNIQSSCYNSTKEERRAATMSVHAASIHLVLFKKLILNFTWIVIS